MTSKIACDLCIIGAGSAGLSIAAGAAQLGRKVVLVEKGEMGGDCLNYGCVPSKALIAAAAHASAIRKANAFGVSAGEPQTDFARVMAHVHAVIAAIAPHDSQERFEGLGVNVIRAPGAFIGPRELMAGDTLVRAKRFVIATGSSPDIPPIKGLDCVSYMTNETVFGLQKRPDHLIIIGAGPVGAELAQAFRRLGAAVSLIDAARLLNREDPEAVDAIRSSLLADGVALYEESQIDGVRQQGDSIDVLVGDRTISGSHLLIATGRRANVEGLDLEKASVRYSTRGVDVNDRLQTSNPRIFAAGDVAGGMQFTHVAGDHASTIVRNILFKMPAKRRDKLAPRAIYTEPELASAGLSETEARAFDAKARIVRAPFSENDRARAERDTEGFVKVATDRKGRILGATIVGKDAGDLIQFYALAIAEKMKIASFTNYIAPYPTRGEAAKRAASAWYTPTLFSDRTRALVRFLSLFD